MPMPTNRFGGTLPEDQTGQPYTFGDYLDDAIEILRDADKLHLEEVRYGLHPDAARERVIARLAKAESLIEQARRML